MACAAVTQLQPLFCCRGPAARKAGLPTCPNQLDGGASCFHLQEPKNVNTRTRRDLQRQPDVTSPLRRPRPTSRIDTGRPANDQPQMRLAAAAVRRL